MTAFQDPGCVNPASKEEKKIHNPQLKGPHVYFRVISALALESMNWTALMLSLCSITAATLTASDGVLSSFFIIFVRTKKMNLVEHPVVTKVVLIEQVF
jgi:hypothetical protein